MKTEFEYNVQVLATSHDLKELIEMKEGVKSQKHYKKEEIIEAIKLYNLEKFKKIRETILKDRIIKTYEVTLILEDYKESFPNHDRTIEEYLNELKIERFNIKIKTITKIDS